MPLPVFVPVHPPDATQEAAFEAQVSVAGCPLMSELLFEVSETVGAGLDGVETVTVVDWLVVPPAPVQVSV